MRVALVVIAMLGYGFTLHRRWAWPLETIPLALAAGSIGVLYIAALAGILWAGTWAIVALGLMLGVLECARGGIRRPSTHDIPPGLVIYVVLLATVVWRLQGAAFGGWDEFSHWGLSSKVVIQGHSLITADSPVLFKDYPPGSALFHYLLSAGSGFSETRTYVAHAILALSALAALFAGSGWLAVIATAIFGYFGLYTFSHGLQSLDVDHIVGLFFGCGLGSYFLSKDPGRLARLVPVVFALPLLKNVGLLLAIFLVCAAITDRLLSGRPSKRQVVAMLLLMLAPIAASQTWARHVASLAARPTFPLAVSASGVRNSFSTARSSYRDRATIRAFREALNSTALTPPRTRGPLEVMLGAVGLRDWSHAGLSASGWTCIFGFFALVVVALQPDKPRITRALWWVLWMALCGTCYAFGLLILYLYSFSEYEGVRLASFARYFGIFFLAAGLTVFAWVVSSSRVQGGRRRISQVVMAGLALLMIYSAPDEAIRFAWEGPSGMTEIRSYVHTTLQPVVMGTNKTDRVYMLWQGSTGYEFYVGRYELLPRTANASCWSLGSRRFEGDVWTCPLTPTEWAGRLKEFEFVVLGRVDETFWKEFGELFRSRNGHVFKVEKTADGDGVQLVPAHEASSAILQRQ
jgi:hypothetical protein